MPLVENSKKSQNIFVSCTCFVSFIPPRHLQSCIVETVPYPNDGLYYARILFTFLFFFVLCHWLVKPSVRYCHYWPLAVTSDELIESKEIDPCTIQPSFIAQVSAHHVCKKINKKKKTSALALSQIANAFDNLRFTI